MIEVERSDYVFAKALRHKYYGGLAGPPPLEENTHGR